MRFHGKKIGYHHSQAIGGHAMRFEETTWNKKGTVTHKLLVIGHDDVMPENNVTITHSLFVMR